MSDHLSAPRAERVLSLLRFVVGLLFSVHGMQKIFGWLAEHPKPDVGTQMWLGGMMELVLGLMICVGLLTRVAAFLASGEMAVAYLQFHWKLFSYDPKEGGFQFHGPKFDDTFWPVVNGGEMALLYCFVFFYFVFAGGGRYGLDALFRREREPESTLRPPSYR